MEQEAKTSSTRHQRHNLGAKFPALRLFQTSESEERLYKSKRRNLCKTEIRQELRVDFMLGERMEGDSGFSKLS